MKILVTLCVFIFTTSLQAQTKLIRHKSHNGTNSSFIPSKTEGNFGIQRFTKEYEKDENSNYKLGKTVNGGISQMYLFYTERKTNEEAVCLKEDRIIE